VKTLVIETATSVCSVALLENGAVVASAHENVGRGHAERLLPMIASLPNGGRASAILVDCGPGSFTGIRVGVAAARGLGFGWGVPVSGYSSLAVLAAGYLADRADEMIADRVTVAINAGHGEVFVQSFGVDPLMTCSELASVTPQAATEMCEPLIIGNAAASIVELRGSGEAVDRSPHASDAVFLSPELATLPAVPIYGRGADAKPMADRVAQ
jgi:tRNA threonylcarbamoyladenosine biosynthesis protein TsaB